MSKPKKRFTTREQILSQIDKFTLKANRKKDEAIELFLTYREIKAKPASNWHKLASIEMKMEKANRSAERYRTKVLPRLRHKLAEFDTEVIPGTLPDNSVEE